MKPMKYGNMMMPTAEDKKNQVLMNCSKGSKNFYMRAYEKQEKSENLRDNGIATLKTTMEDKETEFDQDLLREDRGECEESNDRKNKRKEVSLSIDTVDYQAKKNVRDNGNELETSKMNMKESKSDDEMILESTGERREANEVEKKEKKKRVL